MFALAVITLSGFSAEPPRIPPTQETPVSPTTLGPITPGPFLADLDSLKRNRYPEWFTKGKLGIWAHWGPQSVPMQGDWYARNLYIQGNGQYKDHLTRFGHPSKTGYKDIIPLWHAEKWDPAALMKLYKAAGAKYFVSMGVHHDNFDLWNSRYHQWNAVKMGPKRDVVGDWAKAARAEGLRFGVSEHLGASFTWFQKSRGSDAEGPYKGIPYDGNDPAYEELYHWAAKPGDTGWYSNDPRWHAEWYQRIKDLVDQYQPDLLYSDGGIPFGKVGETLVAHFYNASVKRNGGVQQAVYTCKQPSNGRWAQDVERGVLAGIQPYPWQTDTSIGDWFYNKNWTYRGADWVIRTLADVVSKNGNLLINVVQRPDGSLDPEPQKVLADMTTWMKTNGEAIFDTRPWITFGEGATRVKGGAFQEDFAFTARDVRFTQKGDGVVYAILLGKPDFQDLQLKSFARGAAAKGTVRRVQVLGSKETVRWSQSENGLAMTLPKSGLNEIATVIKISGENLRSFTLPQVAASETVMADVAGNLDLSAGKAEMHGSGIAVETKEGAENIGFWDNAEDYATWTAMIPTAGRYELSVDVAAEYGSRQLRIQVQPSDGTRSFADIQVDNTGGWTKFVTNTFLTVALPAGKVTVTAKAADPLKWAAMNLRSVKLRRVP